MFCYIRNLNLEGANLKPPKVNNSPWDLKETLFSQNALTVCDIYWWGGGVNVVQSLHRKQKDYQGSRSSYMTPLCDIFSRAEDALQ